MLTDIQYIATYLGIRSSFLEHPSRTDLALHGNGPNHIFEVVWRRSGSKECFLYEFADSHGLIGELLAFFKPPYNVC